MSIRLKLLFSYTWLLLVTVFVFFATAYFIAVAVTGDVQSVKQFYKIHFTLQPLTPEQETLFSDLKFMAKKNPDQLLDPALWKETDFNLRVVKASLLIRKGDGVAFLSPQMKDTGLERTLPPYDLTNISIRNTFNIGDRFFGYAKYDFTFSDQTKGSIFVVREVSPYSELIRKLLPILITVLVVLLLLTNVLLFAYVTRSIVRPLNALRESALRIKEGDLDFQVKPESGNEIGQLSSAFEEMRLRLKASVQLRLKDEENRKELISNISHDLKTPITTIKGYIEGIRDGVPATKEKMDKYVNTIYSKAADMDRLIDELFLYSKLDLNKVPFNFETLDLRRFVEDVTEELLFDLEEQGFRVELPEPGQPVLVRIDPEKMRRTIANLIGNCVKYMDKRDKRIRIRLYEERERVAVEIEDNGPGMEKDVLEHIFDRFYRAEPSRDARTGGSGLGLAIAKQIVEGHGGTIGASSKPGEGTRIRFALPKMKAGGEPHAAHSDH
ncbi:HAMP domain-containing sensor histidine kinase [Paenibacillus filicis]|uniref:histidine kinase n=1 Tax=Paenibacillus gyeongsangnamensis TaxID=3388067 RepID=A0ABT4QCF7_9BACL|nr:HAMP domain-containing sensor histidine kinase [Paenibacillus filicis]MCZ8514564.1 HAMP domain-containing sensor histidine kinase [Paenibacillus filicis]